MQPARRQLFLSKTGMLTTTHLGPDAPRRSTAEAFIREVFSEHYGANVSAFAANLMLLEEDRRPVAAAGWRSADAGKLFLEQYLDVPIEHAVGRLIGRQISRDRIAEVGNLAATKPGSSLHVITRLAAHLDKLDYEWVVFTATRELIGIFSRIGIPLLALGQADPDRLGDQAGQWGSYYEKRPIVVAGRARSAVERMNRKA